MDLRNTAQDVHRCYLCETALVHSYCDFCHVNLCKPCIGEHISDGHDRHEIVPFHERKSTPIYPKCAMHQQKKCDVKCKDCKAFVCSYCVGSKQHTGHDILNLAEVYKEQKQNIKKDREELANLLSPIYENVVLDLENQIKNLDRGYEILTTEISKQGQEWHREIDIVITEMKAEINDIKVKHKNILKMHLEELKHIQSLIQKTVRSLKDIVESNEVHLTTEYKSEIEEFRNIPSKVEVSLPTFIPNVISREELSKVFGRITPTSSVTGRFQFLNTTYYSVRKLLDKQRIFTPINTGYDLLYCVAKADKEKLWTSGRTGEIKCFDITTGFQLHRIKTKSGHFPNDIAADNLGNLYYSDGKTRTVNLIKSNKTEELISLNNWTPNALCITSTGYLLVTMFSEDHTQSKVVRFSGSTEIQSIQFDDEGKPLYAGNDEIKYITENRNHDICVADCHAGAVVVVNQVGKLRFRYTGHFSYTMKNPFEPYGITTDSQSRILTADSDNHCIHILNENGQFLCYIDNCDLADPWGLCVDNEDNLFVCELKRGSIKKIKYSKEINRILYLHLDP